MKCSNNSCRGNYEWSCAVSWYSYCSPRCEYDMNNKFSNIFYREPLSYVDSKYNSGYYRDSDGKIRGESKR